MAIKMTQKDFDLTIKVLNDYTKFGKSSRKCPYCNTSLYKEEAGASYSVQCQTKDCFHETFRGI